MKNKYRQSSHCGLALNHFPAQKILEKIFAESTRNQKNLETMFLHSSWLEFQKSSWSRSKSATLQNEGQIHHQAIFSFVYSLLKVKITNADICMVL